MFNRLGPLEIRCDAPPYAVVRACKTRGFRSPGDVRWCRWGSFREGEGTSTFGNRLWKRIFGRSSAKEPTCTCGQLLPELKEDGFSLRSETVGYLLVQCHRCRTIFWDVALPVPAGLTGASTNDCLTDF